MKFVEKVLPKERKMKEVDFSNQDIVYPGYVKGVEFNEALDLTRQDFAKEWPGWIDGLRPKIGNIFKMEIENWEKLERIIELLKEKGQ